MPQEGRALGAAEAHLVPLGRSTVWDGGPFKAWMRHTLGNLEDDGGISWSKNYKREKRFGGEQGKGPILALPLNISQT